MQDSSHITDISLLLVCLWVDRRAEILRANCLHNGCFQKYRRVGRRADRGFGGAPQYGPGPAVLTAHWLHWTSHASRGVRRALRQLLFFHLILPLHPNDYTAYWASQNIPLPTLFPLYGFPTLSWLPLPIILPHHLWSQQPSSSSVFFLSVVFEMTVLIFLWASIWKCCASWEIHTNSSYWVALI